MTKILHFEGGLGNQMFQFAYYRYLQSLGHHIKLDIYSPSSKKHGGFRLFDIFPNISKKDVLPYFVARPYFLFYGDLLKKVFKINKTTNGGDNFLKPVIPDNIIWIRGLWQSYKYLLAIEPQLNKDFVFTDFTDSYNKEIAEKIQKSESVSIHIRRGDYLKPRVQITMGNICDTEYYTEAISIIKTHVGNPSFFVFSDDIEWVKKNLNLPDATYINYNKKENSFRDMQLMSLCKHNIIANSSFSWWGSWLNKHSNKVVVAPKKWMHNNNAVVIDDLIPPEWHRAGKNVPNVSLLLSGEENINDILNQSYWDFELITSVKSEDKRVKPLNTQPTGNIVISVSDVWKYSDRNYLRNVLLDEIKD